MNESVKQLFKWIIFPFKLKIIWAHSEKKEMQWKGEVINLSQYVYVISLDFILFFILLLPSNASLFHF